MKLGVCVYEKVRHKLDEMCGKVSVVFFCVCVCVC